MNQFASQIDQEYAAQLAAEFRQAMERVEELTAPAVIKLPQVSPDFEFKFIARRVDISNGLYAGTLPEYLAKSWLSKKDEKALKGMAKEAEKIADTLSAEEQMQVLEFQRKIAVDVCVAPKLVFGPTDDPGAIDLSEVRFSGDLIVALFNYAMELSPDVPVRLADGRVVSFAEAETFRKKPALPDDGNNGANVRPKTERLVPGV